MTLKCVRCGMDFPSDIARCDKCKGPMMCGDGMCQCQGCHHEQEADNMWCQACLDEEMTKKGVA